MAFFTEDYIAFMQELAQNNHKEWFHANKKRYEKSVKEPFTAFVDLIIGQMAVVDPTVAITPKEALFRINRDIRFSKDKSPYKTFMAAVVSAGGRKNMQVPGLYFQFGADKIMIAGGMHMPEKENLYKIRQALTERGAEFRKLISDKKFSAIFDGIAGEKNKVLPKEFKPFLEAEPLIANKQFHYWREYPDTSILLRPDLDQWVLSHYHAGRPINEFLRKVVGL